VVYSVKYNRDFRYQLNGFGLLHHIFSFIVSRDCVVPIFCIFSRANNVELSKRIITLAQQFVHAVIWIGILEFKIGIR
jgi:hypothetical protein